MWRTPGIFVSNMVEYAPFIIVRGFKVKVYHTSVVLQEYDGKSFVKRILWKKVTVRVHSITLEAKFRLWMQSKCDMRMYIQFILEYMIFRQSYISLGYSWRLQLWCSPGISGTLQEHDHVFIHWSWPEQLCSVSCFMLSVQCMCFVKKFNLHTLSITSNKKK